MPPKIAILRRTDSKVSVTKEEIAELFGSSALPRPPRVSPPLPPLPPSPKLPSLRNTVPYPYIDEDDPLIKEFGLDFLLQNGYINLPSIPNSDPGFGYGKHTTPAVAFRQHKETGRNANAGNVALPVGEEYYIHPIFSRDMWNLHELGSSYLPHWDALKPVWQLATLLLEEKVMSGFLCGMLDKSTHRDTNETFDGQKLYSFEAKKNVTQEELWDLWDKIWRLKDVVKFEALEKTRANDHATFGVTITESSISGLTSSGKGSTVYINEDILSILCSKTRPLQYSSYDKTDEASCLLRLRYQMAMTLVHELIHSLWIAHFAGIREPFYRDYRYAELGWTYECLFADGAIANISNRVVSPYGFSIVDWPGTGLLAGGFPIRDSPDAKLPITYFPVPMSWLPKHFTQQFWDNVQRYGLPAFKCPRPTHCARH